MHAARHLAALVGEAAADAFGGRLAGAYAIGSLAHGGFSPSTSDVDVATTELLRAVEVKMYAKFEVTESARVLAVIYQVSRYTKKYHPRLWTVQFRRYRLGSTILYVPVTPLIMVQYLQLQQ